MKKRDDAVERAREKLAAGDDAEAQRIVIGALAHHPSPGEAVALHVVGARAARARGDVAHELSHLEQAEELAASSAAGALGGVRLQLGLTLLRSGDPASAARVLAETLPLLGDDADLRKTAQAAHDDAKVRSLGVSQGLLPRAPEVLGRRTLDASRRAKARVMSLLERLEEEDPDVRVEDLLVRFLDLAIKAVKADRGFVLLAEPDGLKVCVAHDAAGHELVHPQLEVSFSIARAAAIEGRTITSVRPAEDPRFATSRSAKRLDLKAVCAAPIRYRRESLGVLVLDRKGEKNEGFAAESEMLAGQFARGAAGVIWRARRYDQQRRAHEALLEQYARDGDAATRFRAGDILGDSEALKRALKIMSKVAGSQARVLIRGEIGTGKELAAHAIHENSKRRAKPFIAVSMAAFTDSLIESELFGYVAGAFTGAVTSSPGVIRRAHGGTLFLDEIAEASPRVQVALLRFLEEGEVRPVGASEPVKVDVRVISSTHQDLEGLVATGSFRADLLHRLKMVTVNLPPLRDRREDVPLLARHFAEQAAKAARQPAKAGARLITSEVERQLVRRSWPGNVRELKNAIEELVALGTLPRAKPARPDRPQTPAWRAPDDVCTLREAERRTIVAALAACRGNVAKTARLLDVSRRGLYYLMEDHKIDAGQLEASRQKDDAADTNGADAAANQNGASAAKTGDAAES